MLIKKYLGAALVAGALVLSLAAFSAGKYVEGLEQDRREKAAIEKAISEYKNELAKAQRIASAAVAQQNKIQKDFMAVKNAASSIDICSNDFARLFNSAVQLHNTHTGQRFNATPGGDDRGP